MHFLKYILIFFLKVITNLLAENHAEIFTEFIQEVVRQLKENPDKIPVIQFIEPPAAPSSPPTLRRQTFKDHLDLEKVLNIAFFRFTVVPFFLNGIHSKVLFEH